MSRNGSGTYSLPAGNPVVTNEVISSTWANTTLSDVASALTDSLSRTGLGGMTNPLQLPNGLIGAPALTFSSETTLGFYRAAAGDVRLAAGGVDIFNFLTAVSSTANNAFSGSNTFTKTFVSGAAGPVILTSAQPVFELDESGAAANQRRWWFTATSEELLLQAANDARTSATTFMQVQRTNNTADAINFTATALGFGAATLSGSGSATWTGAHTFTFTDSSRIGPVITNINPGIDLIETGVTANNAVWRQVANGEQLLFQTIDDIISSGNSWLTVDRTGTTVDRVAFPTDSSTVPFAVGTTDNSLGGLARMETSTAGAALTVSNTTAAVYTFGVWNKATAGDNTLVTFFTEGGSGTLRGSITYNRGAGLIAYNTSCRENLKENIRASESALAFVKALPIVSFDWKGSTAKLPYFVTYERTEGLAPWACQNDGVDVSKLVPALYKAVQEIITHLGL